MPSFRNHRLLTSIIFCVKEKRLYMANKQIEGGCFLCGKTKIRNRKTVMGKFGYVVTFYI